MALEEPLLPKEGVGEAQEDGGALSRADFAALFGAKAVEEPPKAVEEPPKAVEEPPFDWKDWLGDLGLWIIHDEVLEAAEEEEKKGQKITTFHFSGHALAEVWKVTKCQWGFAMIWPFVVTLLSACPKEYQPFAQSPNFAYSYFAPVVIYSFFCEWQALGYTLCTNAMYCAPFKFLGSPLPFAWWLALTVLIGLTSHLDLLTNGLFLSKILVTVWCDEPKARIIEKIWRRTIQGSIVWWVPCFDHIHVLVGMGWVLMMFQPLVLALYGLPYHGAEVTYTKKCAHPHGYETWWSRFFKLNPTKQENNETWHVFHHADILQVAGFVNRMTSICDQSLSWCLARSKEEVQGTRDDKFARAFNIMSREFSRINARLWLVTIFEKAFMFEIQATMFAVSRALIPKERWFRVDWQMLLSLVLGLMTYMKTIYDARRHHNTVSQFLEGVKTSQEFQHQSWTKRKRDEVKALRWNIRRTKMAFILGRVVNVCFLVHCVLKFVMALVCEDSLWDIPVQLSTNQRLIDRWGCVDLKMYLEE